MARDREEPDGRYILIRGLSPGTFQRFQVAKARAGASSWGDFFSAHLPAIEKKLSG